MAIMVKTIIFTLALAVSASSATGGLQLVSVKDEIAIGRRAQQQVRQDVPRVRDTTVTNYVAASDAGSPPRPTAQGTLTASMSPIIGK